MKQKIKNKLEEFAEIRKFANGIQRKEIIDQEVRVYLARNVKSASDWFDAYDTYKEMYGRS